MKKVIKPIAIGAVVFALTMNLHSAIISYYGIKGNMLSGQVWAQSTSTSTSGNGTGGGTSGDGSSSSGDLFYDEVLHGCAVFESTSVPVKVYGAGGSSAKLKINPANVNGVGGIDIGTNGEFTVENATVIVYHQGTRWDCEFEVLANCSSTACSYPPGQAPVFVLYNNLQLAPSTSNPH